MMENDTIIVKVQGKYGCKNTMPLMTEEKTVHLQFPIPDSLRVRLKIEALKQGITLRELAQNLLEKGLKELEKENK